MIKILNFLKTISVLSYLLLFSNTQLLAQDLVESGNLKYVDPTIGNVAWLLQPTRPTVQLPNQMIRMFPERTDYIDDQISSFPLIILSHRLGEAFALKPSIDNDLKAGSWNQLLTYDHNLEVTRPWYYYTWLIDKNISLEFTPGKKTGVFRIIFPKGSSTKSLLFDNYNKSGNEWNFISDHEITAIETYQNDIKIYMYGTFSQKVSFGVGVDNKLESSATVKGKTTKAWVRFAERESDTVVFKYSISYISPEQAKLNFNHELQNKSFESVKNDAKLLWDQVMNQITVDGGTEAQKRSFYTALYRCQERMVDISEDGKYYSGFDKKIHTTERPFYVDDWTWDTYLANHPLRAILNPEQESDMLNSYVNMYEQSGWMPTFPVLFGDHACMNGFHSSIMFLDDYRKGIKNFNIAKAYQGMLKNANDATMLPWRNGNKCSLDDFYHTKGYYPALRKGELETVSLVHPFEKRQAVAVTLGASYDDWAVGQMAKDMGKNADATIFANRAMNYKNLWNKSYEMFYPKDANGNWILIDPKFDGGPGGRDYYDENNGWTYQWQVQQDINGLVGLMGGKNAFENKLDQLFREKLGRSKHEFWAKFPDATGNVGQFSMGNEPSFHIPYLYNYTNAPWKTQKHIRFLLDLWFKDNVFGIPGDEDGGGMSAFVVFSSMGFYPLTPGIPEYTIGSPLFEKVTIRLSNGKQFKVIANHSSTINKYIQSAKLNGDILNKPWFTHEQILEGGTLELEMGPLPNKEWGTAK